MKRLNQYTNGYVINIYVDGLYMCSTDWCKTCEAAIARFKKNNPKFKDRNVTAFFKS